MAKNKKKNKNVKKSVNKKIDMMESNVINELLKAFKLVFIVIVVLSVFYLLTVAIVGKGEEEKVETTIQYDEILAGSSFSMNQDKYLVAYYDFTDEELSELTSLIYNYSVSGKYKIYVVDMNNGFNKPFVSKKANSKPKSADDLAINGPTIIKFADGKVKEYVDGLEDMIEYLK